MAQKTKIRIAQAGVPVGGTTNQVLAKSSNTDNDVAWASASSGSISFGDGSDGDVTVSSPITLTRDMYYNNLVVNSTIDTAGYRIFVKGTISGSGTIQYNGANGSNGSNGDKVGNAQVWVAAGGPGGVSTVGYFSNPPGSAGNNIATVDPLTLIDLDASRIGGTGGTCPYAPGNGPQAGGASGSRTAPLTRWQVIRSQVLTGLDIKLNATFAKLNSSMGGTGGGGGGAGSGSAPLIGQGGGAGGGGASGGLVFIAANIWAGTFVIKAIGGNGGVGGNGGNTTNNVTAGGGGGGGGAGGNGGTSVVIYGSKTWTGSYLFTGGNGGIGGNGGTSPQRGNGNPGATGQNGTTNTVYYEIPIASTI